MQLWVLVRHVINSGLHERIKLCMCTLVGSRSTVGDQVRSGQRGKVFSVLHIVQTGRKTQAASQLDWY